MSQYDDTIISYLQMNLPVYLKCFLLCLVFSVCLCIIFMFVTFFNSFFLFQLIGSAKVCYASEQSEVNPNQRHMVLKTINLTFCRHIAVNETLRYVPHPSDPNKTLLKQEAVVMVKGVPFYNYMEDLLTNKISKNAGKGRQAMEWVINKLDTEVKEFASSAAKSTDELLNHTKKSIDDITLSAKKSMDDISNKTMKTLDEIQNMRKNNCPEF